MPVHNHAIAPLLIRPSWLSRARRVEGATVARTIVRPEDPFCLPFARLPATVDQQDEPILQLFVRAAEAAALPEGHRCSGCAGIFRERSRYLENAAELAKAALRSPTRVEPESTATVLLYAITEPMAQVRRYFRSIEPMPVENYPEQGEWWDVYLQSYEAIAVHVYWVVAAIRFLTGDGDVVRYPAPIIPDVYAVRWDIRNYVAWPGDLRSGDHRNTHDVQRGDDPALFTG